MRILLMHGWLHTTQVFDSLKEKLPDHDIVTWEFKGLDNSTYCTMNEWVEQLQQHLQYNEYDLIVAHSLGCNVLLRVNLDLQKTKVLLLNPVYANYRWYVRLIFPVLPLGLSIAKCLYNRNQNSKLVKLFALFTCNNIGLIDDKLLRGLVKSNVRVLYELLYESVYTFDVYLKDTVIVYSNEDRLLKFPSKLQSIKSCNVYRINGGHTSFLEREEDVIWIMRNSMRLKD